MSEDSNDSADENEGKYSTDEEMTFEGVLKSSLRSESPLEQTPPESSDTSHQVSRSTSRSQEASNADESSREDSDESQRTVVATRLAEAYADGDPKCLVSGETGEIGLHTEYELARSNVGEDDYYYLAQVTDRSYNPHRSELVVKDFGLEWSYDVLELDTVAIQRVIEKQRRQDFQAGSDPVEYLTEAQATDVVQWYQDRSGLALYPLKEPSQRDLDAIHLLDQYLVVDMDKRELLKGGDLDLLTERQRRVITTNLLGLVRRSIDVPLAVERDIQNRFEFPLMAELTFDS